MSLDRRRKVPSFDELQAQQHDQTTDPLRPAIQRPAPIPQATVVAPAARHLDDVPTRPMTAIPPGILARQPVMPIRTPTPPTQPGRPALQPPPLARTAPPTAADLWSAQSGRPSTPQKPQTAWNPGSPTEPPRAPVARVEPPSPVEYAQARPANMPQVTPSVPSQGAVMPEGQSTSTPHRASHAALKPVPPRAPVEGPPEPLTSPLLAAPPRSFTPSPQRKPSALPAEMLVTQPGLPGPFAHARAMPQPQAIPTRSPSMPEVAQVVPPPPEGTGPQSAFGAPQFDDALLSPSDTVTAEPAALWRRLGAWLVDLLFVSALVLLFLSIAMTVIAPRNLTAVQQLIAIALPGAALASLLAFVYTALFAFLWSGRTPGRRMMGIHLVDATGHAPGPARALVRAMLSLVSFGLFLSGFWLALFDRHGQTLHDKLTRTFVVKLQDA